MQGIPSGMCRLHIREEYAAAHEARRRPFGPRPEMAPACVAHRLFGAAKSRGSLPTHASIRRSGDMRRNLREQVLAKMAGDSPVTVMASGNNPGPRWVPLALGFRPFFLAGILSALLLMAMLLYGFSAGWMDTRFGLRLWHGHEMLFGYTAAIIAGFLLTAVRNWTGLPTPTGLPLAMLAVLWLLPRLLYAMPSISPVVFAGLDMLFLPLLAIILGRPILKKGQVRNYPVPALLLLMAACNAAVHLEAIGITTDTATPALQAATCLIIGLISVIAGRVVPFFMRQAIGSMPRTNEQTEQLALPSILLLAAAIATGNDLAPLIIGASLLAALVHGLRLIGWFDPAILRQPMLWVLHAGYAWIIAGFLLYAGTTWLGRGEMQALHAWTLGGIGLFTTGMMARVALGHTGRRIHALPGIAPAFILIFVASAVRVFLPLFHPSRLDLAIYLSAGCWLVAFVILGMRYTGILMRPRLDGKPG